MADFQADRLKAVYQSMDMVEMKDIPIPRKDLFFDTNTTLNAQVLQTSRGCPLGCNFCTVTQMYGKKFRPRPVSHIVEEIKRYPSRIFFFVDNNIFLSKEHAYELFEALIPFDLQWD